MYDFSLEELCMIRSSIKTLIRNGGNISLEKLIKYKELDDKVYSFIESTSVL